MALVEHVSCPIQVLTNIFLGRWGRHLAFPKPPLAYTLLSCQHRRSRLHIRQASDQPLATPAPGRHVKQPSCRCKESHQRRPGAYYEQEQPIGHLLSLLDVRDLSTRATAEYENCRWHTAWVDDPTVFEGCTAHIGANVDSNAARRSTAQGETSAVACFRIGRGEREYHGSL